MRKTMYGTNYDRIVKPNFSDVYRAKKCSIVEVMARIVKSGEIRLCQLQ